MCLFLVDSARIIPPIRINPMDTMTSRTRALRNSRCFSVHIALFIVTDIYIASTCVIICPLVALMFQLWNCSMLKFQWFHQTHTTPVLSHCEKFIFTILECCQPCQDVGLFNWYLQLMITVLNHAPLLTNRGNYYLAIFTNCEYELR